ncbi:MAG: MarR family transcriptional regulator [Corynebacterium sp.]|uniref:MarR family transcriptional regulator n=1 Tax=Corynebacterium sp. TaxID=1720 RepID=UPI0026F78A58|nr:MarR family transcriptional regulator [Corynebacterium sp.]
MLAVHARYRGRETRRADLVRRSGEALSTMSGVAGFESLGVEDIRSDIDSAEALCNVVMALLSDGAWAIGVGVAEEGWASEAATHALGAGGRAGTVKVSSRLLKEEIAAVFLLIAHVLSKRSVEGREATSLMRAGFNQNEAAAELGISKQAMSQRLHAAGWQAELSGWRLAVNLISMADR